MKKGFFVISMILIVKFLFNATTVKAEYTRPGEIYNTGENNNSNNNESNYSNVSHTNGALKTNSGFGTSSPSANLPINNGNVFLMIAGIIIGTTTLKKYKSVKTILVTR